MVDPLDFSGYEMELLNAKPRPISSKVRFFYDAVQNNAKSQAAGRPIYDMIEMVSIINPGSRDEFISKVTPKLRETYGPQYEHWRKTEEQPSTGTPLETVPFLNIAQVRELRGVNIDSLEHLASLSDAMKQKIGMGATELVRKAQAYIAAGTGSVDMSRVIAENEILKRDNAALKAQIVDVNQYYSLLLDGKVSLEELRGRQPGSTLPAQPDAAAGHQQPVTFLPSEPVATVQPAAAPDFDMDALAAKVAKLLQPHLVPEPKPAPLKRGRPSRAAVVARFQKQQAEEED